MTARIKKKLKIDSDLEDENQSDTVNVQQEASINNGTVVEAESNDIPAKMDPADNLNQESVKAPKRKKDDHEVDKAEIPSLFRLSTRNYLKKLWGGKSGSQESKGMLEYNVNFDRRFKSLKPSELKNYEYAAKYGPYPKEWYPEMRSKAMDILEQVIPYGPQIGMETHCLIWQHSHLDAKPAVSKINVVQTEVMSQAVSAYHEKFGKADHSFIKSIDLSVQAMDCLQASGINARFIVGRDSMPKVETITDFGKNEQSERIQYLTEYFQNQWNKAVEFIPNKNKSFPFTNWQQSIIIDGIPNNPESKGSDVPIKIRRPFTTSEQQKYGYTPSQLRALEYACKNGHMVFRLKDDIDTKSADLKSDLDSDI
ncbi:hypothetical protein MIR68_005300 [Amoeboaphelidium protococcarum]|nr:hypothetical protein MIR68_012435 [Amoeboaphelidium protococcarum]KAI3636611.1 hypothetical protein MIR68_005300 [Amoeboaphelidium protococcarum]KAI3653939.1 hypothetical protein MP228_001886 [Amoeboaphelidium protococcarum]